MNTITKKTTRILALIMAFLMALSLAACSPKAEEEAEEGFVDNETVEELEENGAVEDAVISEPIKVAALNGPTGMATVNLMDVENIDLTTFQAADEAVQKFVSGEVDIAAVPSNLAAVLYNKTEGNVVALTTIASGVLYLVENGNTVTDLEALEGKTIVASGKGGTPEYVLTLLLKNAGLTDGENVTVEWLDAHADVAQKLMQTEGAVALLPEPFVSNVLSKSDALSVAVDLNEAWNKVYGDSLPMGVVIAKKPFVEARSEDVAAFLVHLGKSVDDVNTCSDDVVGRIVAAGFLQDPEITKTAIPRCNISCLKPEENKAVLETFYKNLFEAAPEAVGGKLPGEDFYYAG